MIIEHIAVVVRAEEAAALRSALGVLPAGERETLLAHEVHGADTATLARSNSSTPGAIAARLARARACLRVEYVMALRRVEPPHPGLSAGPDVAVRGSPQTAKSASMRVRTYCAVPPAVHSASR